MKKVLIWIGCFLFAMFINIILHLFGLRLGYMLLPAIIIILPRYLCKKTDIKEVEKEAFAKGMSIRQYVTSIVPSSLIGFCEAHKGEPSVIKENLKHYIEEGIVTKRIAMILLEMYK